MTTAYTSLLGLALPVTGELSGTWGDTVNTAITSLLDSAVAGTTSITVDADITLTTTTGASNESRQAIILWNPASGTTTRYITAPAQSKLYTVINASGGTQSIVIRGVGPTTGVTIAKGESAMVAWNGSDFVKVSSSGGALTLTDLTVTGNTILGDAAADTLTVNATSTFASPVNFQGQVRLPSTGRSAAAALTPTNPAFLYGVASTYTDTTSSGTLAPVASFYGLAQPTLSTSNVTTYTTAATLYIANAPAAGGSATITNPYALYVAAGNAYFGDSMVLGSSSADTVTVNATITSNLLFTDNTYDIGASGATRPRDYFGARNITLGQGGTGTSLTPRLTFNGSSASSSSSGIVSTRNGSNYWFIGDNEAVGGTAGLINYVYASNPWSVAIGGSEIIYANGAGTGVGIFNNNPSARLHVSGAASTTIPGLLVESSGTLASNDVIRFSIVGLTNGFRMRQDASSAVKYSFEGGNVGVGLIDARSQISVAGNIGLNAGGLLNNLYYDGSNWRYSVNSSGIGWYMAGNTNQIYWGTAPASGTQDAIASTTDRMYLQSDGLFQLSSGPTWVAGGFAGMMGKQLCMGYDTANSIGYLRSTNNGTTGTALYLDGSEVRINIGTTTNSEVARFNASGLTFPVSSNLTTSSGYLNIQASGALILDTGSGSSMTFRRGSSDIGYWDGNGLAIGGTTSPGKLTITGGNASIGANAGWLNNLFYDGNWKSIENGWGAGSYTDSTGLWHFISTAASGASYGSVATVQDTMQLAYGKSVALAGSVPQTGTGITFPASQYASSNANTLDDYEEGSFTPSWGTTGTAMTVSYSEQNGVYVKIGRMVYYRYRLVVNSASGGTGNLRFEGLPFTAVNNGNAGFTSINFSYGWSGANAVLAVIHSGNTTSLDCYTQYAAYNSNAQTPVGALTAGGIIYFIGGGCYEATN